MSSHRHNKHSKNARRAKASETDAQSKNIASTDVFTVFETDIQDDDFTLFVTSAEELHRSLVAKFAEQGALAASIWRSWDRNQRARCLLSSPGLKLLKHPSDVTLGAVRHFVPEINLKDIISEGPDYLLSLIKTRASTSLWDQYVGGSNGQPGDASYTEDMMKKLGVCLPSSPVSSSVDINSQQPFAVFKDNHHYGVPGLRSVLEETFGNLDILLESHLCVPRIVGGIILIRQRRVLHYLNSILNAIIECESSSNQASILAANPKTSPNTPSSLPSFQSRSSTVTLSDLLISSKDIRSNYTEVHSLLWTDPLALSDESEIWFRDHPIHSTCAERPEPTIYPTNLISSAVFNVLHNVEQRCAVWRFILWLLHLLLQTNSDIILQKLLTREVEAICKYEYQHSKGLFKRSIQQGICARYFKPLHETWKMIAKVEPQDLTITDPQAHYILRLCHPSTTPCEAVEWLKKLSSLLERSPEDHAQLKAHEAEALYNFATTAGFVHDLFNVLSISPSIPQSSKLSFPSFSRDFEQHIINFGECRLDLNAYASPISYLRKPANAERALNIIRSTFASEFGIDLLSIYFVSASFYIESLWKRHAQLRAVDDSVDQNPFANSSSASAELCNSLDTLKGKNKEMKPEKKKKPQFTIDTNTENPQPPHPDVDFSDVPAQSVKNLRVSSASATVFANLFDKSESRGPLSWASFQKAMVELGFSVISAYGSARTFTRADPMGGQQSITLHRPHSSRIEGRPKQILSRRLTRSFGWNQGTFEMG